MSAAAAALDLFLVEVAVKCQFVVDKLLLSPFLSPLQLPPSLPPFCTLSLSVSVMLGSLYSYGYCRLQWKTKESQKWMQTYTFSNYYRIYQKEALN